MSNIALLLLRAVAGFLYMQHGLQKLLHWPPGGPSGPLSPLLEAAGYIEVICGALIMLGLATHLVAFVSSGEMAVGYFMVHFPRAFWPILNMGEVAVLYCFIFLFVAVVGPGRYSLDAMIWPRERETFHSVLQIGV